MYSTKDFSPQYDMQHMFLRIITNILLLVLPNDELFIFSFIRQISNAAIPGSTRINAKERDKGEREGEERIRRK